SAGKSTSEKGLGTTLAVIFAVGFILPLIFSSGSLTMLLPIMAGVGAWYLLHKRPRTRQQVCSLLHSSTPRDNVMSTLTCRSSSLSMATPSPTAAPPRRHGI